MGMRTVFIPEGTSDEDLKAKFADDMAGKAVVMKLPQKFDESILDTMLVVQGSSKPPQPRTLVRAAGHSRCRLAFVGDPVQV